MSFTKKKGNISSEYTREQYSFASSKGLKQSSANLFKGNHWFNITLLILTSIYLIFTGYNGLVLLLNIFSFSFFLYKFILSIFGLSNDKDEMLYQSKELPKYCILLPMRNEPVEVVRDLVKNIEKLNYPKDKLDVVMLIDQDDKYLTDITNQIKLPSHFRILSSEATFPFTKPKVCNLGLITTDAEYVTVYDAEDSPEPDQLLKVLYKFESDPNISCVQCRLHYNNKNHNLLTKFFNLEYLTWFSLTINGLSKIQGKGGVVPLGGTSQHLKVKELVEIGGWDAINVTEDCDLGVRLSRLGKTTAISTSYTDEIAVEDVKHWIPQRTRWQLGFMVTYINHCKDIVNLFKDLGPYRFFHYMFTVAGSFINPLITPLLFIIWFRSFFLDGDGETFLNTLPWITLVGNLILIILTHMLATIKYQKGRFWYIALFQPIYYLLQTVTVYRAVYKLITAPYKWEKTEHKAEA